MITTEEIAVRVRKLLLEGVSDAISGTIDYERNDYSKEDVIVVPHTVDGEGSLRFGQVNVNIHVPDVFVPERKVYRINYKRLIAIREKVVEVLHSHYEKGCGYNWTIGRLNPAIKEPDHNEHFVSLALEITIREK